MALFSIRANSPMEHMLRLAALFLVLGALALGFWKNSERQMERLNARLGLSDETRSLSADERDHVQAFIIALRKDYGIEARVQVTLARPTPPPPDGKTLFLGLCPEEKTAVVQLPPLVARSLGPDFARQLEQEHFPFHFGPGKSWQQGLLLALDLMQSRLAALGATQQPSPPAQPPVLPGSAQDKQ